MRIFASR